MNGLKIRLTCYECISLLKATTALQSVTGLLRFGARFKTSGYLNLPFASVGLVGVWVVTASPVTAGSCGTSDTSSAEYFCTGDVLETNIDATDLDDDISEIIFNDIDSSEYEGTYVFSVDNTGDEGNSHGDDGDDVNGILVYYDGSDSTIEVSGGDDTPVMSLTGAGGKGHSGDDRTSSTSSGNGGNGGDGGTLEDAQILTIVEGTVSGDGFSAVEVTASGGNGGSGGDGTNYAVFTEGTGGDGGNGGDGATAELNIDLNANLNINVNGEEQAGIYVLSSGGDGNDGGDGDGGSVAYAGDGGYGGRAGDANFYQYEGSTLIVETDGQLAHAVEVISRGGDGGDGGDAANSIGDAFGGDGASGGDGGTVTVEIDDATLTTTGDDSIGILARSYGGAGGDGGSGNSGVLDGDGGSASGSGNAGDVNVTFGGTLTTTGSGDDSDDDGSDDTTTSSGILAQSVAGFSGGAGNSSGLFEAWGASSESAGNAVTVTVQSGSTIETNGIYSVGIEAQSIGGGGGKGGSADAIDSVGGDGSAGGDGGKVTITVDSDSDTTITTTGDYSAAISAQSVGGGGGKSGGGTGLATIGGTGGTGGDGGEVGVMLAADLTTTGDYSEGVFAQSLGGGGGVGHSTDGLFSSVGGSGGDGGSSDAVSFEHVLGNISTSGIDSDGVDLQSIGGGGGKGASSMDIGVEVSVVVGSTGGDGGDGGTVTYSDDDDAAYSITTVKEYSAGISAQSGGGGGGNSGSVTNITASVGVGVTVGSTEDASSGGNGDAVSVETHADITTSGEHSDGIFAQSYGGGGGNAGQLVSVDAGYDFGEVSVSTGGSGGAGGDGGAVSVTSAGDISTSSAHSFGIYAQSAGGSGGKSSSIYTVNSPSVDSIAVSTGASGGSGGDAAAVTVNNSGDVATDEDNSTAIYAQSVGGGGGNSGTTFSFDTVSTASVTVSVGGDGGDGGSSDAVSVTNSGKIIAKGENSDGIFAQSLAGGGGNSGSTYSGSGISGADVAVAVGGFAGDGDTSGAVNVKNTGDITVSGSNGSAIYAESRGGSGGKSGSVMAFDVASYGTVDAAVGGEGGDGGAASTVYVENFGNLTVSGDNGVGIYANSQGGEGGNSGTVIATSAFTADAISVGIGAGGGAGGTADDTSVYNYGSITTSQDLGYGILAQSIGGAGGNGSSVISADLLSGILSIDTGGVSGDVAVAVGGDGGDGGTAGTVYVESNGAISTSGEKAYGILAQSIGGNGGSGGSAYTFDFNFLSTSSATIKVTVGGSGAEGAASDAVQVVNNDLILTNGTYAHGIFGQSVGGSGGTGGSVTAVGLSTTTEYDLGVSVAVGGEGGDGSAGAEVDIANNGAISVLNNGAAGIYAQSIGGDGGDGGSATTYVLDYTGSTGNSAGISLSLAVGGEGGTGNDGDIVRVTNSGLIHTSGSSGDGIFAQSVGGGGGDGGSAEATSIAYVSSAEDYKNTSFEVGVELGGSGGSGGDGGLVDVVNEGKIVTTNDVSVGIFAQSVGGGGGTGGESGSTSSSSSDCSTSWVDIAEEIASDVWDVGVSFYTVYSLYQNYSSYFTNWTVSIGGDGGATGDGGQVDVSNSHTITTHGVDSTAIYAQSVGGGGGSGGTGTGASIKTKVEIGGTAGAGGHGGSVNVVNSGDITTSGTRANGIWAQSVGGGGGDAGDVEGAFGAGVDDLFGSNFSIDIGFNYDGDAGNGGDGGDVSVQSTDADINISGENSVGIWAQSVGGGGGTAGSIALSFYFAGSNGAEGDSGDVDVALDGANVISTGDYSFGVFAQSSSGSYETSDVSDLDDYFTYDGDASYESGHVNINLTNGSSIDVSGEYSRAILAASTGYDSAGAISINVGEGSSISGSDGNAHVISLYDGNSNVINNYGTIADEDFTDTSREDDVYVIYTDVSSDDYDGSGTDGQGAITISNYGTISGSIKLFENATGSTFLNASDGVFNMGSIVDLGSGGGTLSNLGTLSPGGSDQIFTSTISGGALAQGSAGSLLIDLEMNTASDDENVDVIIADKVTSLEGTLTVNATGVNKVSHGASGSVFVLVSDDLSEEDLTVSDTVLVDYDVALVTGEDFTIDGTTYSDTNAVELTYAINASPSGTNENTTNTVNYFGQGNTAETGSGSSTDTETDGSAGGSNVQTAVATVFNELLNAENVEELETTTAAHIIDETGAALFASRQASHAVHNNLRSCPSLNRENPDSFLREKDCGWVGFIGSVSSYENAGGGASVDESTYGFTAGGQRIVDSGLILGGLLQGEDVTLSGSGFDQDGHRFIAAAVLKYENGPLTFSLSTAYGHQSLDQQRQYSVGGVGHEAKSDVTSHSFSADARVTYLQEFKANYLRWGIGLGLYHTRQDGFEESGDGALNWAIQSSDDTDVVLRPTLEFGRLFGEGGDLGRVYASAGLSANLTDPSNQVNGSLIGLSGDEQMAHVFNYDRYAAEVRLGLDYQIEEHTRITIRGGGTFSENSRTGDMSVTARWMF
ncbi:hypothetical protein HW561_22655 [Rhodobacteraceae bacterium B1Z28]|uniref:Autotransporter domain-containing protein n=1 Tax=Ruegeria haliotis TaxID=2747601 RepID=A0ABX2PWJ3_9RHOB|nr:autotransporter outer membrane beta-barrel domain-containing protein [Ruegeria haliotis]NVO58583.1 hypothetical protein [Ruegeria haliotis]